MSKLANILLLSATMLMPRFAAAQTVSGDVETHTDIEYVVHGGQSLKGTLYAPRAPGKYPVVVGIHGGGWQIGSAASYRYWGPWLAARGYAVFSITYRFSKPAQKSFPEAVQDVRAAVQFLRGKAAELKIDPDRIALMGDSAGGHLASLAALAGEHAAFRDGNKGDPYGALSSRVKAVISFYGVYDMAQQWRHDQMSRPRDHITEKFLGASLLDDRRVYFDASPLSYVSQANNAVSFLINWGTEDDIVDPKAQGEMFVEALKQARYYVRSVIVTGAPHFWASDPVDEPNSHGGFVATRLLRFLQARL
jgi:acetyl esterase/lipase